MQTPDFAVNFSLILAAGKGKKGIFLHPVGYDRIQLLLCTSEEFSQVVRISLESRQTSVTQLQCVPFDITENLYFILSTLEDAEKVSLKSFQYRVGFYSILFNLKLRMKYKLVHFFLAINYFHLECYVEECIENQQSEVTNLK